MCMLFSTAAPNLSASIPSAYRAARLFSAAMMNDEKYQHDLLEKRHLAKQNHLPFVIIDMTDYEDETGRNRTRLNFSMLKRIFINICLGKIKCAGEIIRPYVNAPPAAAQKGV